jgi:hypothetical protein
MLQPSDSRMTAGQTSDQGPGAGDGGSAEQVKLTVALPLEERQRLERLAKIWMKTNKTTALVRALRIADYL